MNVHRITVLLLTATFVIAGCCCPPVFSQYGNYQPAGGDVARSDQRSYGGGVPGSYQSFAGSERRPAQDQTSPGMRIFQWFSRYDQIRRQAQMSPQERREADYFLSKITAVFVPGEEKMQARQLLTRMVSRYRQASIAMKQLPMIPETAELHRGYYSYFVKAGNLFIDYLKVQDNVLAMDPQTGTPIAAQLIQRKQALENHNQSIQYLDQQLREKFGIPPYRYQ